MRQERDEYVLLLVRRQVGIIHLVKAASCRDGREESSGKPYRETMRERIVVLQAQVYRLFSYCTATRQTQAMGPYPGHIIYLLRVQYQRSRRHQRMKTYG